MAARFISIYDECIDMLCSKKIDKQESFRYHYMKNFVNVLLLNKGSWNRNVMYSHSAK